MECAEFIYSMLSDSDSPTLVYALARSGSSQTLAPFIAPVMTDVSRCLKEVEMLRLSYKLAGEQSPSIHPQNYPKSRRSSFFYKSHVGLILSVASSRLNGQDALKPCSSFAVALPPSSFCFISWASGLRIFVFLISSGLVIATALPRSPLVASVYPMPHRRHRMRSRRGQTRRVRSSSSSKSPSLSSDFSVGHYPHT